MSTNHSATILVVDDTEASRYSLLRQLQRAGYAVQEAATGLDGLRLAARQPDLVILDVELPDGSGYDICRQLKADPLTTSIPVLQISAAFRTSEDKVKGLDAGADGFLAAPVDPGELLANVRLLLRLKAANDRLTTVLSSIAEGYFSLDAAWRFITVNRAAEKTVFHRPARELVGKVIWEEYPHVGQSDCRQKLEACVRAQKPGHFEWQFGHLGEWFELHAYPRGGELEIYVRDITEAKRAQKALLEGEERLRLALEASRTGIWVWDMQTDKVTWSPECYLIHGMCEQEFEGTGLAFSRLIHPEDRERVWQTVRTAAASGTLYACEFRIFQPSGEVRWVANHGRASRNAAGIPLRMTGTIMDITARKRSEEALRESEEEFRAMFVASSVGKSQVDPATGRFLRVNAAFCKLAGYSEAELLKRTFIEITHPEDRAADLASCAQFLRGEATCVAREKRYLRPDGSIVWAHVTVNLIRDVAGRPMRTTNVVQDITARKQAEEALRVSEERYRATFALASVGIAHVGLDGRWLRFNDTLCTITGYSPTELQSLTFGDITHPDDLAADWKQARRLLAGEINSYAMEKRYVRKDNGIVWVNLTVSLLRDTSGTPVHFISAMADITARKQAEEALQKAQEQLRQHAEDLEKTVQERTAALQETVHELEQYSYSISHDMRAPLRAMNQYSQILVEDFGPKLTLEGQLYLERISAAATRLDRLIRDVLSYHRIARAEMSLERVDLEALARDIIQQYPMFHVAQAQIEIVSPLLPVRGNMAALTQCLSNLLGNAVKFVATGTTPRAKIWTEPRKSFVRVWVEDNGIGLHPSHLNRIWDIFQQVHAHRDYEGTGIGLSIVKKAVERMGGSVGVDSQPGKGSRFWFELPASHLE